MGGWRPAAPNPAPPASPAMVAPLPSRLPRCRWWGVVDGWWFSCWVVGCLGSPASAGIPRCPLMFRWAPAPLSLRERGVFVQHPLLLPLGELDQSGWPPGPAGIPCDGRFALIASPSFRRGRYEMKRRPQRNGRRFWMCLPGMSRNWRGTEFLLLGRPPLLGWFGLASAVDHR